MQINKDFMDSISAIITEYLANKAFDALVRVTKESFDKITQRKLIIDKKGLESAINKHISFIQNWASEISFRDLKKSKQLRDTYIDLDLYFTPKKTRIIEEKSAIPLRDALDNMTRNLVILGNPGAGKTTSMKFICTKVLYDENFLNDVVSIPILVRLRDLKIFEVFRGKKNEEFIESLYFHIYGILGLQVEIQSKASSYIIDASNYKQQEKFLQSIVISALEELKVLLILDGLDEVDTFQKNQLVKEIRELSLKLNYSKIILTCRTGEYNYSIDNAEEYEICELNDLQIKNFIEKWLESKSSETVYKEVMVSPFKDTLARPLTLAHLCAIFERYGRIPEKPKTLYKKIVTLLIEEWDAQRSIIRKSKYSNFDTDRKFDFLCNLAFYLTSRLQLITFTKRQFQEAYQDICTNFGLPKSESEQVAIELESHTGLFLQTGYEEFEFAHKSLQEYLTAEYIVRLAQIPFDRYLLYKLANELSLAVAISSNPTTYFSNLLLVNLEISKNIDLEFCKKFLSRLKLEKPDFITSPILGVAFLKLAEKFNGSASAVRNIFCEFVDIVQIRESIILLKKYYQAQEPGANKPDDLVSLINKNAFVNEVISDVPSEILISRSLWDYATNPN